MLIKKTEIDAMTETEHRHQFNDNAVRMARTLSRLAGLERIGIHIVRLQPGRESTEFHYHDRDEEFLYILQGRGVAHLGDEEATVGPGDFMGFSSGSEPHVLSNPFDVDLVYLMGGEKNANDVVHYPRIKRSLIKSAGRRMWAESDHLNDL